MSINERYRCAIVRDLLPLYIDGALSRESREYVEEHLKVCGGCGEIKAKICDSSIETAVVIEKEGVLSRFQKKERGRAWTAGAVISVILLIPVVITAIVAAAGGTDIGTVLVLAASMCLAAALSAVPLMSGKYRFSKTVALSAASVVLIELFVSLFFGGGPFYRIAVPTVFGISLAFLPFVMREISLPKMTAAVKGALVLIWDSVWLYLTVWATMGGDAYAFREGMTVGTLFLILAWLIFAVTRLPKRIFGSLGRAGIIIFVIALWEKLAGHAASVMMGTGHELSGYQLIHWTMDAALNDKINSVIFIAAAVLGIILTLAGVAAKKRRG
ncbi:MAG: zf-HC2 domain-containing protein [Clostridia bacterium]|nr:zf-HC2 domain-containing protein [Clostridia bacterium]